MSRLLLVGYDPPPFLPAAKIEAAHYRSQQFLQPLLEDGHRLLLCGGAAGEAPGVPPPDWAERLEHRPIAFDRRGWRRALQAAHDAFAPDAIVAVGFSHCLYATALRTERPRWMDIYGDTPTIMQAAASRAGSERGVGTTLAFMRRVLRTGDVFSACGTPQQHALVGELAMCGRLGAATFGYDFVRVVLPGAPPPAHPVGGGTRARPALAAHGIRPDDVVVLWCGGYNTWTDVDTLFHAVERAMARSPGLHYVSAGASTYALRGSETAYERLGRLIAGSPHRDRYHLLGWRPWSEVAALYADSDVGISLDARHYETIYGTRTRLVEMIGAGLPVVTTVGPELSQLLHAQGAALVFDIGDADGCAAHLSALAADPARRRALADAALACAAGSLSFRATTAALRAWAARPAPAPDRRPGHRPSRRAAWALRLRTAVRLALWQLAGRDR